MQSVDFWREQADDRNESIQNEGQSEKRGLMEGVERGEIGRQEGNPDEQSCRHRDEDVPAFVEIVRKFP